MFNWNEMNSLLTEDIQYTFIDFPIDDVVQSCQVRPIFQISSWPDPSQKYFAWYDLVVIFITINLKHQMA